VTTGLEPSGDRVDSSLKSHSNDKLDSGVMSPKNRSGYSSPRKQKNSGISGSVGLSSGNQGHTADFKRQQIAEMVSQIRKYDPYPCILGIPVMPALFATCKFYIFVGFVLIGTRVFVSCLRMIW
jgi:hypothetical protein